MYCQIIVVNLLVWERRSLKDNFINFLLTFIYSYLVLDVLEKRSFKTKHNSTPSSRGHEFASSNSDVIVVDVESSR